MTAVLCRLRSGTIRSRTGTSLRSAFRREFISEAVDQTRGWFYTLLAIGTLVFGKNPFENCIVLGHVQDMDGQKMSKHKGNVVDPWDRARSSGCGRGALGISILTACRGCQIDLRGRLCPKSQRKFMGTLWNTYAFYVLYADIDGFEPHKAYAEHGTT